MILFLFLVFFNQPINEHQALIRIRELEKQNQILIQKNQDLYNDNQVLTKRISTLIRTVETLSRKR